MSGGDPSGVGAEMSEVGRPKVGYASGAFDLLHIGHIRYLQAAAQRCQELVVGIPNDDIVAGSKGQPPVMPQAQRLEVIAALACVARAVPVAVAMSDAAAFVDFVVGLGIDAMFIGAEWADSPRWVRLRPSLERQGISVVFLPRTEGVSTTGIGHRIACRGS